MMASSREQRQKCINSLLHELIWEDRRVLAVNQGRFMNGRER